MDIVNSVAISKSFIDNLEYTFNFFGDCFGALKYEIFGLEPDDTPSYQQEVTSGSYKEYSVFFRDWMKFMGTVKPEWGVDNIVRNTSPYGNISSGNYYINKVAPTGFMSAKPDREENSTSSSNSGRSGSRSVSRSISRSSSR